MSIPVHIHAVTWLHDAVTPEPLQFHIVSVIIGQLAIPVSFIGFKLAHIGCFLQQVLLDAEARFCRSFESARILRFLGYNQCTIALNLVIFELANVFENDLLIFEYLQSALTKYKI